MGSTSNVKELKEGG